jgi:hypothetical protein
VGITEDITVPNPIKSMSLIKKPDGAILNCEESYLYLMIIEIGKEKFIISATEGGFTCQ